MFFSSPSPPPLQLFNNSNDNHNNNDYNSGNYNVYSNDNIKLFFVFASGDAEYYEGEADFFRAYDMSRSLTEEENIEADETTLPHGQSQFIDFVNGMMDSIVNFMQRLFDTICEWLEFANGEVPNEEVPTSQKFKLLNASNDDGINSTDDSEDGIVSTDDSGEFGIMIDTYASDSTGLSHPSDLAVDSDGNLYIAFKNDSVIYLYNKSTDAMILFAGNGTAGFSDDPSADATTLMLNGPFSVSLREEGPFQGLVFIVDTENHCIRMVVGHSRSMSTFLGLCGGAGGYSGDGAINGSDVQFRTPHTILWDSFGNLVIADTGNNIIRYVNISHTTPSLSTLTGIVSPIGLGMDSAGNVYIVQPFSNIIKKLTLGINAYEALSDFAGTGAPGYVDDVNALSAQFQWPRAVAFDSSDNMYISDVENNVIRMVNAASGNVTTVIGVGLPYGNAGDGGVALKAQLNGPFALVIDASDVLYFTEVWNTAVRYVYEKQAPPPTQVPSSAPSSSAPSSSSPSSVPSTSSPTHWYESEHVDLDEYTINAWNTSVPYNPTNASFYERYHIGRSGHICHDMIMSAGSFVFSKDQRVALGFHYSGNLVIHYLGDSGGNNTFMNLSMPYYGHVLAETETAGMAVGGSFIFDTTGKEIIRPEMYSQMIEHKCLLV